MEKPTRTGFTLLELVLLIAVLCLAAAVVWPAVASVSAAGRWLTCASRLRQIGKAYQMYLADYERYPAPARLAGSPYVGDRRILVCPDDTAIAARRAASSYHFRQRVPPDFRPIAQMTELEPATVVVNCDHHLGRRAVVRNDETRWTPPAYPYHLVLRAGGSVDRVAVSRIRTFYLAGDRLTYMYAYPGDPGYERAAR